MRPEVELTIGRVVVHGLPDTSRGALRRELEARLAQEVEAALALTTDGGGILAARSVERASASVEADGDVAALAQELARAVVSVSVAGGAEAKQ